MNIKRSIVGSMFSMLLVSEMAAADWGDVYYCQMTSLVNTKITGEKTNYKLERFQFKLDPTKKAMIFGGKGYFKYNVIELISSSPSQEIWSAYDRFTNTQFRKGKFLHTANGYEPNMTVNITVISADCDKF